MSAISPFRRLVDRVPIIGRGYRDARDRRAMRRLTREVSPYGFALWGGNYLISGLHEAAEVDLIARQLSHTDVFVDCGANGGLFTCLAGSQGVRVVAVEPLPSNLAVLYRNLSENAFSVPIEVFPVAVGARPGLARLYGRGQGASLVPGWGGQPTYDAVTVPVLTLDTILGRRFDGSRIVIKIDVEGAEWDVLAGAEHTLAQRPAVLMELSFARNYPGGRNPHYRDILEYFWTRCYRAYAVSDSLDCITSERVDAWMAVGHSDLGSENVWFSPQEC